METSREDTGQKKYSFLPFVVLLLLGGMIYLRDPRYFASPRFWAEEGVLHFAYAYNHPWWQALFRPQVGYLNFWPNLATVLSRLVRLEYAPLVTTILALLVQLVPPAVILWSCSPLWKEWWRKLLGIAVAFFVPLSVEGWLNTINSYTFFGAITFLILLEDPPAGRARRLIYAVLLMFGGLAGTLSCFLFPFFLYSAITEKKKERWIQALILVLCSLVQIGLILMFRERGNVAERFSLPGIATLGSTVWAQTLLLFATGFDQALTFGRNMFSLASHDLTRFQWTGRVLLTGAGMVFLILSITIPWRKRLFFLGSYGAMLILSVMFTIIPDKSTFFLTGAHQRHFLAPNMIFGWMLVQAIQFREGNGWRAAADRAGSVLCAAITLSALFWGVINYRADWTRTNYWPDWKQEVSIWRADAKYQPHIQPEGWNINMKER